MTIPPSQANAAGPVPQLSHDDDFVILELVLRNYLRNDEDIQRIREAYQFARQAHEGQTRASGEPYFDHPVAVAEILAEYHMDVDTIMAGLLHDVVEDTPVTAEQIEERFGERVCKMVMGVTKVGKIGTAYRSEEDIENFRRMLVATAQEIQVIIIKLADRLHNMRTLHFLPRHKQRSIARQTLDIYAPLAHRLGLGRFKWQLEDLCLMFLHPESYDWIKKKVSIKRGEREKYIESTIQELEEALKKRNLRVTIEGRAKHFYSIYQKMQRDNRTFEELYDLTALRVITETVGECYAVLGEIHTMWRQVEGRFKDYISCPKPNQYRSIHTTVLGPRGRLIEIQIRTHEMHAIAEQGIAAHWRYKEIAGDARTAGKPAETKWLDVFEELPDTRDPDDFFQSIRSDLFSDEVFVYTPQGDLVRLPVNATPIDFAYRIHTELGHRCGGAKVNQRMAPLNYSLKTGDVVEVISSTNAHPSPSWLDIVKTASARNKIRRFLLESRRDELAQIGETNLTRELKKAGFNHLAFYNSPEAQEVAHSLRLKSLDDLFVNIGFGRVHTKQVIARLLQPKAKPQRHPAERREDESAKEQRRSVVRMGDIDNILYRLAQCCNPLPGDHIVGFVTRGRGVTLHKASCRNITHFSGDSDRLIEMFWEDDSDKSVRVAIEVMARDRRNLLSDLSQMISSTGTNILSSHSDTVDGVATFQFQVEVLNTNHLTTIMQQTLGIEGVRNVRRLRDSQTAKRKSSPKNGQARNGNGSVKKKENKDKKRNS